MAKISHDNAHKETLKKRRFRDVKQGKTIQKQHLSKTTHYASSGVKIKAFLTDAFMLVMPIMYLVFYFVMDGREDFAAHRLLGWLYILLPLVAIQTLFMHLSGQTPGYRAYNITLIDERTKKRPILPVIIFRNLSAILSLFTLFGWVVMFFRKDNKTLHDLLSATAVVTIDEK